MSDAGKNVVSGTFGSTGQSAAIPVFGFASVLIEGLVATIQIERSVDGGANWFVVSSDGAGTPAVYTTATDVAFNGRLYESESQVLYRFNCTAWTSNTNYRMAN